MGKVIGLEHRKENFSILLLEWITKYNDLLDEYVKLKARYDDTVQELQRADFEISVLRGEIEGLKKAISNVEGVK